MKLSIEKSDIVNGVSTVIKAIPGKTTMNILECILIDATENEIRLVANDTDFGIQTIIPGNIIKSGMIAIDAKMLSDIVRKLPDGLIVIETDDNFKTNITYGDGLSCTILGKDGELFTDIGNYERERSLTVSQYTLKEMIKNTIFSINENDANKVVGGECFEITPDLFKIVSLDGQRISIRNTRLSGTGIDEKIIIPGRKLNELIKILPGDTNSNVTMLFNRNQIVFEFDDTVVISRLIEGEYFNIYPILNINPETRIKVNKKKLYDCVDRSTLFVKEGDKKPIIFTIDDNYLKINIKSVLGKMDEKIEIEKEGSDLKIGFNPKFLIDAIRVIEDEEIIIYFTDAKSPCIIKDDNENYTYVVLPVNFANVD